MKEGLDKTPIACSLTTVEWRDREAKLLAQFRSAVLEIDQIQEVHGGYAFHLPGEEKWIRLVVN
jgi:hypothetical protein